MTRIYTCHTDMLIYFFSCIYCLWHDLINPYVRKNIYSIKNQMFKETKGHYRSILLRRYVCRSHWKCNYWIKLLKYPSNTLQQIRKQKYNRMVAPDRSKIDSTLLTPSPRAVFYHELRVYLQVQVWNN